MTEAQARTLATSDKAYAARKLNGKWLVWCNDSDHAVEFDNVEQTLLRMWKAREA